MPRKSKEELKVDNNLIENTEISTKTKSPKAKKASTSSSKSKASKTGTKSSGTKATKTVSKSSTTKATKTTAKSTAAKTTTESKVTNEAKSKANSTKKTATRSTSKVSKSTTKKATKNAKTNSSAIPNVEYYDLPYRYNETVVKILAQTPTMLFIYWDISDEDRKSYIEKYGENFFNETKPVLVVTNKTMNYTFEVDINDFANSWYLHVNDADCDYSVELGRRPIYNNANIDNYVYVTTSNDMEMPNNHILFDKLGKSVFFKNVKNNFVEERKISSISFIKNIGKVYDIYEFYKDIYGDEINEESGSALKLNLSSSSSSTFK